MSAPQFSLSSYSTSKNGLISVLMLQKPLDSIYKVGIPWLFQEVQALGFSSMSILNGEQTTVRCSEFRLT